MERKEWEEMKRERGKKEKGRGGKESK